MDRHSPGRCPHSPATPGTTQKYTLSYEPRRSSSSRNRSMSAQQSSRSSSASGASPRTPTRSTQRRNVTSSGMINAHFIRPAVSDAFEPPRAPLSPPVPQRPPPLVSVDKQRALDAHPGLVRTLSPRKSQTDRTDTRELSEQTSRSPMPISSFDDEKATRVDLSVQLHPHSFASKVALNESQEDGSNEFFENTAVVPQKKAFQPKGVVLDRTNDFLKHRREFRKSVELDEQRLERRLKKMALVYSDPESFERSLTVPMFDLLGVFQSPQSQQKQRFKRLVAQHEQSVVKWQEDHFAPNCAICITPFSLAVRRHHCRLCGRVVCSSPQLPPMLQAGVTARDSPCSSLCNVDPNTLIIRDLPPLTHRGLSPEAAREYDELELHAFRICFDCHTTLMRAQYRTECRTPTPLVRLYTALVSLQKKIEEALPDFHEMILGLQYVVADRKNDATCTLASAMNDSIELQHDAAQARKNLLHQFAQYDKFAKQIRDLQHQSNAEGQVQQAIYLRATLFLQKHMLALQSVPSLQSRTPSDTSPAPAPDRTAVAQQVRVLQEQDRLLTTYLVQAAESRSMDDIAALKANKNEVRSEIARLQRIYH